MKKITFILIFIICVIFTQAQTKTSNLPPATSLTGAELIAVVQSATSKKATVDSITAFVSREMLAGGTELANVAPLLADTIPYVAFSYGSGYISDTAAFNNGRIAGSFTNDGSDTLIVVKETYNLMAGSGTETIDINCVWGDTLNDVIHTHLHSTATTITSHGVRTTLTSFNNTKIPPSAIVWFPISGASSGNKPTFLSGTISVYKKPNHTH